MLRMDEEIEQLRSLIRGLGPVKNRRRYGSELRARIVAHARLRNGEGESIAGIARSLEMAEPTLANFLATHAAGEPQRIITKQRRRRQRRAHAPALVPIRVVREAKGGARHGATVFSVRGPCGLVIEAGLEDLARLIARIAECSG